MVDAKPMSDDDSPLIGMFGHFALISMMAVGGGVVMLAPDIHRYVVDAHHWISSEQFAAAYTLAQAAPGPNMLYVTLVGYWVAGLWGAIIATAAVVLPPAAITVVLVRMTGNKRFAAMGNFGRAIRAGLAPVSVGLLAAGGWVLAGAAQAGLRHLVLAAATVLIVTTSKINPIFLIAAGALVGILGLV
jgi:chromate transporter